jgi:hypothetical protein
MIIEKINIKNYFENESQITNDINQGFKESNVIIS